MATDAQGGPNTEVASPTEQVHRYLASKGLQPTGENVRRVLEQNASNPGLIAGLTNQEPPKADAPTASRTNTQGGVRLAEPPMPPPNGNRGTSAEPSSEAPRVNTTSPPDVNGNVDTGLSSQLMTLLGLGAGVGGGMALGRGRSGAAATPVAPAVEATSVSTDPQIEFKDGLMNGRMRGQQAFQQRAGIAPQPGGPTSSLAAGPDPLYVQGVDPMKSAMDKAVPQEVMQPPGSQPTRPPSAELQAATRPAPQAPQPDISIPPKPSVAEGIGIPRPPSGPVPTVNSPIGEIMQYARINPEAAGKLLNELQQSHALQNIGKLRGLRP